MPAELNDVTSCVYLFANTLWASASTADAGSLP